MDLLGGVGLKTWEQVGSDRQLVESQGGNNWYFDHGKADGDRKGRWVPETTESGVLLTGYMGEKDTGDSEMTPDFGGWGDGGDTTHEEKEDSFSFRKGLFDLEHFEFEHVRVP